MGFASGFSAGANAVNSYESRKRQEKLDEQNASLHAERMDEIKQAKADKQALRDAGAERTTMQGTAVTTGAGDKNLYADPMQAAAAAEDAKIEAEMRGQQPSMVSMQSATGITGKMAQGHQITTDPVDLKAINGAEAKAGRFQSALEAQGKPMEALNMSNAVIDNKAKSLGLETAQLKFATEKYNRDIGEKFNANPDWKMGLSQILTETQLGRLKGVTVNSVVSADGNTVSFVADGPDGAVQPLATFPNNDQGKMQALQMLHKAPIETQISYLAERGKAAKADLKDTADIELKKSHANYYTAMAEVAGRKVDATLGGVSELDKIALNDISKEKSFINQAIIKAQAEGSYEPSNPNSAGLITKLATLTLKEGQIAQKYSSSTAPDPLNQRKPTTSESQMKVQAAGDMGQDPKAIQREIDKTTADILKVADEPSKALLQAHLVELKRQQGSVPAQAAPSQQSTATPPARPTGTKPPARQTGMVEALSGKSNQKMPATPVLTMEQIQQQTRQNRERIVEQNKRIASDPEIQALRQKHALAIRAGKSVEANGIADQIEKLKNTVAGT